MQNENWAMLVLNSSFILVNKQRLFIILYIYSFMKILCWKGKPFRERHTHVYVYWIVCIVVDKRTLNYPKICSEYF